MLSKLVLSSRSKSTFAPLGIIQAFSFYYIWVLDFLAYQLGYTVSSSYFKINVAEVEQNHSNVSPGKKKKYFVIKLITVLLKFAMILQIILHE